MYNPLECIKKAGLSLLQRINSLGLLADRYLFSDLHLAQSAYSALSARSGPLLFLNRVVARYRGVLVLMFVAYMLLALYLLKYYADGAILTTAAFQEAIDLCKQNQTSTQEYRTSMYTTTRCFPYDFYKEELSPSRQISRRTNPYEDYPLMVNFNGTWSLLFINISKMLMDVNSARNFTSVVK
jgi:hypothetical protein